MKFQNNERGFTIAEFDDLYGNKCIIQKSSAALYDAIWMGISNPVISVMVNGQWQDVKIPADAVIHSRMHLSQKMVRDMLPALEHFAKTGELPS